MPAEQWIRYQKLPADENQILAWFADRRDFGVGLIQGSRSGTIVLDFDADSLGLETLADLERRGLPQSVRAFTPGGGCHVVLRHPGKHVSTRKRILPGMDVRGDGGFIVACPSTHANGREYAWDVDCHPEEVPVADCPDWLTDLICGDAPAQSGASADIVRVASPGPLGTPLERVADGREQYMRDTILAVCVDLNGRLGRTPTPEELFGEAWPQYAAKADLSRPGRGEGEFRAKVAYTLHRYESGRIKAKPRHEAPDFGGETIDPETGEILPAPLSVPPLWVDEDEPDPAAIPPRPWIVPGYLMRGSVSVLSGQGAGGKSSLVVAWSIALADGKPLGAFHPRDAFKVINYNVEDDQDEQRRRYAAAAIARRMPLSTMAGRIIRCGPHDVGTLFERDPNNGRIFPTPAMDELEKLAKNHLVDVLICDPLAELHNAEENDNTAMRAVIAAFRAMAKRLGIAILILHHDRKGNSAPGDMDRMRGASAVGGAVRVALTLSTMSQEEADRLSIPPESRRAHFRIDGAKSNYAPSQDAEWWRLAGYEIANGETVAACLPWVPPSPFDGLSMADCVAAIDAIHAGTKDGYAWATAKQAGDDWAGRVLTNSHCRTDAQASTIIAAWVKEGVLSEDMLPSPRRGHKRNAFVVNLEKVSEMRRQKVGEL
jgi:hypothetical protein